MRGQKPANLQGQFRVTWATVLNWWIKHQSGRFKYFSSILTGAAWGGKAKVLNMWRMMIARVTRWRTVTESTICCCGDLMFMKNKREVVKYGGNKRWKQCNSMACNKHSLVFCWEASLSCPQGQKVNLRVINLAVFKDFLYVKGCWVCSTSYLLILTIEVIINISLFHQDPQHENTQYLIFLGQIMEIILSEVFKINALKRFLRMNSFL